MCLPYRVNKANVESYNSAFSSVNAVTYCPWMSMTILLVYYCEPHSSTNYNIYSAAVYRLTWNLPVNSVIYKPGTACIKIKLKFTYAPQYNNLFIQLRKITNISIIYLMY